MQSIMLIGNTARKPEVIEGKEKKFVRFTLAVNSNHNHEKANFISCLAFGKTAELIVKYVDKGARIAITGEISTGSYDHKDGHKVYTTDVIAERVQFLTAKKSDSADAVAINDEEMPF